jgi:hypothetical protein
MARRRLRIFLQVISWWTCHPLCASQSPMARSKKSDRRDTHHTVSAGILESVGRGFLIATATIVAGVVIGTAQLAALGLWMVGAVAVSGVGCFIGSALVKNAGYDRCEKKVGGSPRSPKASKVMAAMPLVEAAGDVASEERWARRIVMSGREPDQGPGRSA